MADAEQGVVPVESRHVHIHQDEVERRRCRGIFCHRVLPVLGLDDLVAAISQNRLGDHADQFLVVHDQDAFMAVGRFVGGLRNWLGDGGGRGGARKKDGKLGSLADLAFHFDPAGMLGHQGGGNGQSEACSPAGAFGGEIRFKNAAQDFGSHAVARVSDRQLHEIAHSSRRPCVGHAQADVFQRQG